METCDEKSYYKGFNLLGDLKEIESMESHNKNPHYYIKDGFKTIFETIFG